MKKFTKKRWLVFILLFIIIIPIIIIIAFHTKNNLISELNERQQKNYYFIDTEYSISNDSDLYSTSMMNRIYKEMQLEIPQINGEIYVDVNSVADIFLLYDSCVVLTSERKELIREYVLEHQNKSNGLFYIDEKDTFEDALLYTWYFYRSLDSYGIELPVNKLKSTLNESLQTVNSTTSLKEFYAIASLSNLFEMEIDTQPIQDSLKAHESEFNVNEINLDYIIDFMYFSELCNIINYTPQISSIKIDTLNEIIKNSSDLTIAQLSLQSLNNLNGLKKETTKYLLSFIKSIDSKYKLDNNSYTYIPSDSYDYLGTYSATAIYKIKNESVPYKQFLGSDISSKLSDKDFINSLSISDLYNIFFIFENIDGMHNDTTNNLILDRLNSIDANTLSIKEMLQYLSIFQSLKIDIPTTVSNHFVQKISDIDIENISSLELYQIMIIHNLLGIEVSKAWFETYESKRLNVQSIVEAYYIILVDDIFYETYSLDKNDIKPFESSWGYSISLNDNTISLYTTMCGLLSSEIINNSKNEYPLSYKLY